MTESAKQEKEDNMHIDLYQKKLSKAEWDYMEIPESNDEIEILNLIKKGFWIDSYTSTNVITTAGSCSTNIAIFHKK